MSVGFIDFEYFPDSSEIKEFCIAFENDIFYPNQYEYEKDEEFCAHCILADLNGMVDIKSVLFYVHDDQKLTAIEEYFPTLRVTKYTNPSSMPISYERCLNLFLSYKQNV